MIEGNPSVHDMTINIERKIDKLHKAGPGTTEWVFFFFLKKKICTVSFLFFALIKMRWIKRKNNNISSSLIYLG